ncbi:major facilitator superfamily domain-containing protein 6 isoform X2 [Nasonia vitripennis]|uniref:Major facilitator superfamily associated domain-containing protein n=1 Tax=Nasonia vitripennis TaxID=7425 RepID=A0A7M7PVP5_NASVI|nr:major facilitator superfamily domain-containing protein 6 isoform X2 [Nasonia vitripennis]XP_031777364.1 major facilitator superfamily domain-containing protein 6 isoform X2 [Nasonia vitripennis]
MQNFGHEEYDYKAETYDNESISTSQNLPQVPGARPIVNPEAEGTVDPSIYPQPKEATHKIRGKNDFIEYLFGAVDQELLTVKTFYFFFYSAFGSLFPLMGVYFKQMGMNAGQCGLLIGLRPFIEFFSAPFWGSWADRWQKGKLILLASLSCWIIFTLPLGFIQPPATSCMLYKNHTNYLYIPDADQKMVKRSLDNQLSPEIFITDTKFRTVNNISFNQLHLKENEIPNTSRYIEDNEFNSDNAIHTNIEVKEFHENRKLADIPLLDTNLKNKFTFNDPIIGKSSIKNLDISTKDDSFQDKQNVENDKMPLYRLQKWNDFIIKIHKTRKLLNTEDNRLAYGNYQNIQDRPIIFDEEKNIFNQNAVGYTSDDEEIFFRYRRSTKQVSVGQSPVSVSYAINYKEKEHKGWVKPVFSSIVYRLPDIQKTFFLLLLLVIVGEFFSAPAITLADSAVITLLGEDADRYGHQRMFGSLGWGLAMFFVGIALDHSTAFPDHPCGPDTKEKNYTICFAIFSVLMGAALITATQINFKYDPVTAEPDAEKSPTEPTREEQLQSQLSQQLNLPGLQETSSTMRPKTQPLEGKTKMFAQTTREIPEWVTILQQFKDLKCASFLFVAWFMGFGIGLIFTFLFWHLQDYGGTPTLFGVASVINHISEIFAYFFSFKLIRQIGHVKVLCLGLSGNVIRFLYISWLKNPWWVLPFEFMQGITHAAVWAACCSYIAHNTPTHLRSSAQSVLQGLHHGLGRGCGAVIGGMFVAMYGTTATFRAYGLICLIVLAVFIFINFYRKDTGFVSDLPQTEDPHQVAEVTHLAPHGVPSNAIPRALSSNRLNELTSQDLNYGATHQTSGGNLNVPGGNGGNPHNPFLNNSNQRELNYSITSQGNDEFIRRSFQQQQQLIAAIVSADEVKQLTWWLFCDDDLLQELT